MRRYSCLVLIVGLLLLSVSISCRRETASQPPKRYPLKGKVVSIEKNSNTLVVDHEAIPNFMSAMTMPYIVKPASQLDLVTPGDTITGDVVVQEDQHLYWLENIVVTEHVKGSPPKPSAAVHIPSPGELVPDFQLTNQDGKKISFKQYRGKVLMLTFIYTRCPFADYCPRVSGEFAKINRQLGDKGPLSGKVHLLSISFDPTHDKPAALRDYGFSCAGTHDAKVFRQWEFAVAAAKRLPELASFFGLSYQEENGLITHSLSTAVIGPDGRIVQWYHGNEWQAADLLKDAASALGIAS